MGGGRDPGGRDPGGRDPGGRSNLDKSRYDFYLICIYFFCNFNTVLIVTTLFPSPFPCFVCPKYQRSVGRPTQLYSRYIADRIRTHGYSCGEKQQRISVPVGSGTDSFAQVTTDPRIVCNVRGSGSRQTTSKRYTIYSFTVCLLRNHSPYKSCV